MKRKQSWKNIREMVRLYTEEKLGTITIAKRFNCCESNVRYYLKQGGIKLRSRSEALKNNTCAKGHKCTEEMRECISAS